MNGMKFEVSCTVFNRYKNADTKLEEYYRTVLHGVHWEYARAANVMKSGLSSADSVTVYVWKSIKADGKEYLPPVQFANLDPSEVANFWTLAPQDRIVKGVVPDLPIKDIISGFDHVLTITSADDYDYGRKFMQHWRVSGK